MAKNEKKGGSPKEENRCPVCGRFASKKVLDACKGMMSEVERTQREQIAMLSTTLAKKNKECKELHEIKKAYEAMIDEYNALRDEVLKLKSEVYRLEHMSLWERIFG